MTQKWNLQDIRPAEVKKRRRPAPPDDSKKTPSQPDPDRNTKDNGKVSIKNKSKRGLSLWVGMIVILVGAITYFGISLSKTTLTVSPEFKEPNVNSEFTAYPDSSAGSLVYELMSLDEVGEKQVTATGEEHAEEQAKGIIEIIKKTPGSERLIKNTRFRSPDGLVFRIQESVVVPGATKNDNGDLVSGTTKAEVFADDIGQEYNLSAGVKFDIPGFKESNLTGLYNAIYAESSEDFTGGFDGPRFLIDEEELSAAREFLHTELKKSLLAKIDSKKPADFIAFDDAVTFTFSSLPSAQSGDGSVVIKEKAVLRIPLFKHQDLAKFLATETITTYSGDPVRIRNIDDMEFSYTDDTISSSNISTVSSLSFSLVGKPLIVWEYNPEQLKKDLSGKPMTAISTVIPGHPGINKAVITGKPFWRRSFPDEPEDIKIIEELDR